MRIITKAILDIETLTWDSIESYEYSGPLALADRAAQNAAKKAAGTAGDVASQEQGNANAIGAQLTPFYRSEMNAQHLYNPEQTNELLNFAEAPLAGTGATTAGAAASEAARTRNPSGFSAALDQSARDRQKALGTASLGVGAADINGAKALNQEGAAGMSGLYGVDTNAMLKAMGQQNEDIRTGLEAGNTGWFQNLMGGMKTLFPKGLQNGGGQVGV